MKLDHGGAALKVERSHDFEQTSFSINNSAIAFQVLSSGLYQDKIAAVIRELSTNAWDGHRLRENGIKNPDGTWAVQPIAGRTKLPFKVELPTTWNPVFAVRDYGVGLDHDGIMKLYTTYFGSTKSDSNDFTGALGLGSKSPFSMSSSFLVISYYNGTKRTYTAMIGEDGFPTIVKMDEVPTSEDNGLEVRVTVDPSQIHMFKDRAAKIYAFFDVPPEIPGLAIKRPEYELKTTKYGIRKADRYGYANSSIPTGVTMGQICYPITLAAMEGKIKPHIYSMLERHSGRIDFFCEIGEVEFQASREALSYTNKTFRFFEDALENFFTETRDAALECLANCKTYMEAILYIRNLDGLTKQVLEEAKKNGTLQFRGNPIDWSTAPTIKGTCPVEHLAVMTGDPLNKDIKNPREITPKYRVISSTNGETLGSNHFKYNETSKLLEYSFPIPTYNPGPTAVRVVFNDLGAPLYRIRAHLSKGGYQSTNQMFLVDKKHEDVAQLIAKIYELKVENISAWGMDTVDIAQIQKLARIFTPTNAARNTYDMSRRIKDEAELKDTKFYICTRGNAHVFDAVLDPSPDATADTNTVNSYLVALQRYGFLKAGQTLAIVSKTKEDEFKKLMPDVKHVSTIGSTKKWDEFTVEQQREISALVFRSQLKDNRFEHDLLSLTGEYRHFLTTLQELPRAPAALRNWATETLNTYQKLATDTHAKLSKGNRPVEPKPLVGWFANLFKGKLVDFQAEVDAMAATEKLLTDHFPVFQLLRKLYYKNTSHRYYNFDHDTKELISNLVITDLNDLRQKLSIP